MIYHRHAQGARELAYDLNDLDPTVRDAVEDLRPHVGEFDTLVAQGMSGVVVAAPLALLLKKKLSIVRKANDNSHQQYGELDEDERPACDYVIGLDSIGPGKRVLFVDDFVGMGRTRRRVLDVVTSAGGTYAATYTYQDRRYA